MLSAAAAFIPDDPGLPVHVSILPDDGGVHRAAANRVRRGKHSFPPGGNLQMRKGMFRKGRGMFNCPLCTYISSSAANVDRHFRVHTGEKPFKCSECSAAFAQSGNYKRHMRSHARHRFSTQPSTSAQSTHLSATWQQEQEAEKTVCAVRPAFSDIVALTGNRPYKCNLCSYAAAHRSHLMRHMKAHASL